MIPYGSKVKAENISFARTDIMVQAIPERVFEDGIVPEWKMAGGFVKVSFNGLEGYAFNGYLSHYNPAMFQRDTTNQIDKIAFSVIDTLFTDNYAPDMEYGETSVLYSNGITEFFYWDKAGGGGGTITIPNASLATGYLIAEKWFRLNHYEPGDGSWDNPTITARTDNSLTFHYELTTLTITEVGGTVIIIHDSHC